MSATVTGDRLGTARAVAAELGIKQPSVAIARVPGQADHMRWIVVGLHSLALACGPGGGASTGTTGGTGGSTTSSPGASGTSSDPTEPGTPGATTAQRTTGTANDSPPPPPPTMLDALDSVAPALRRCSPLAGGLRA